MSSVVILFLCMLFAAHSIAQLCKSEGDQEHIKSSHSFDLNKNNEEHAYLFNIREYESGSIALSLYHKWTHRKYETKIDSDKYNSYHYAETLHQIQSAKEFIHFINISMINTFRHTYYEIVDKKQSNNQIVLRLYCEECVIAYDIQIPFTLASMDLANAILLLQDLSRNFNEYKKSSETKIDNLTQNIDALQTELEESKLQIVSLQNQMNTPDSSTRSSFDAEVNILIKSNANIFTFTGYPNQGAGSSSPKHIADQVGIRTTNDWQSYGYQTKADSNGIAYIEIDLKKKYYITKYAVSGYPGGNYKPNSVYYLQASNDRKTWNVVGMSGKGSWTSDALGTYPFRFIQQVTDPGFYRYYKFYASAWPSGYVNGWLLIMNAGLWTPQKMLPN